MAVKVSREPLRAVAHHEAGHAVVALFRSIAFRKVTIAPEADALGYVLHSKLGWFRPDIDSSPRVCARLESYIIVGFSGQIAEARFRGRRPQFGFHSDNRKAVDLAFYRCSSEKTVNAYLKYCWCASEDEVKMRWREIRSLAKALMERPTLTCDDVREVVLGKDLAGLIRKAAKKKPSVGE